MLNKTSVASRKARQLPLLKREKSDYGGSLRKTRKGRAHARPLTTKTTMHVVLHSTKAVGEFSFRQVKHDRNIRRILQKFAFIYGVKIVSFANAWNHLHLQIKLTNRFTYAPFIKAVTGAIAMSVSGRTRWTKAQDAKRPANAGGTRKMIEGKFWDHRPFTRIVQSVRAYFNLKDYVRMNEIESDGFRRKNARQMTQVEKLWARSVR